MTLIFSTSSMWTSAIIRWFTRSRCSHVMLGCEVMGIPMLLHCTDGGVQFTPRKQWFAENRLVAEYTFKPDISEGVKTATDLLGLRYDYMSLVGFVWVLFWRWLKYKVKNPLASARAMVCSEFILHVDHKDKIPEWNELEYETTTAEDLLVLCEKKQSFEPA